MSSPGAGVVPALEGGVDEDSARCVCRVEWFYHGGGQVGWEGEDREATDVGNAGELEGWQHQVRLNIYATVVT